MSTCAVVLGGEPSHSESSWLTHYVLIIVLQQIVALPMPYQFGRTSLIFLLEHLDSLASGIG